MIEEIQDDEGVPVPRAVSVVIPAFNEGTHVAQQVRDVDAVMRRSGWPYEVIVVDDGSGDQTAREADATGARVLRRVKNRGYGAALKLGVARAQHGYILITDADGTYPVEAIPVLLEQAERHAMVVGARVGDNVAIPLLRRPAKAFIRALASYLSGEQIPDLNSGLRVMRKDLVQRYVHLLPDGFSFTTTITLASICNGHPVRYVPIDYHARLGESKIRARHAYDFTLLILRVIVFFNPLKVFIPVGALLALAGLAKLGYDIVKDNLSESAVLALLGALIIWCVGLLADQNARMAMRR
ncbi:MAG: glycosyltransferase family 2 protein [Gammaproteobacteria bacterium]|nr:glycosyltransferase family 2 protein [Gammaproteobacteria bacterium]